MTLQEFIKLHPNIIQYDRAGVDGIDLEALHVQIEKSRYLKTRQSFVYFVKNYKRILSGEFTDFKLDVAEVPVDDKTEKQKELARMRLANLKEMRGKTSGEQFSESIDEGITLLEKAIDKPFYMVEAFFKYKEIVREVKEFYQWVAVDG